MAEEGFASEGEHTHAEAVAAEGVVADDVPVAATLDQPLNDVPPPPAPHAQPRTVDDSAAEAELQECLVTRRYGVFTVTPKQPSDNLPHGGYQARCVWHRFLGCCETTLFALPCSIPAPPLRAKCLLASEAPFHPQQEFSKVRVLHGGYLQVLKAV
eukprot:6175688-Alexandrium_andersonii.AAC.1